MSSLDVNNPPTLGEKPKLLTAGIRSAIANIGWLSSDRFIRLGGALLVGTLVARYLGPAQYGLFNLALAIYLLFNIASNLGLDFLVVRDVVLDPENQHSILGTSFLLKVAASVVATLAAIGFAWATHPHQAELVAMVAILSVASISQGFDVIDFFFQAKLLSRHTVAPKLVSFVLFNLLRLWAIYRHAHLMTFVELMAFDVIAGELALLLSYWKFARGLSRWSFDMRRGRKLLAESWPMMVGSVLAMVYMRTDQILLGYFRGEAAVGYYSVAVRLSEILYMIPTIICSTVMPKLLPQLETNKATYYGRLQQLYNYFVLFSVALALFTIPVSHWLIGTVFGAAYLPAAPIFTLHVWTAVFVFIGVLGGQQLVHENLFVIEMQRAFMGAVVNLVLNLLLIRRFGVIGSALATLAAQATASYLSDIFSKRTRHMFRMKTRALSGVWILRGEFR